MSRGTLLLLLASTAALAAASVPVPGCANPGAPPASAAPCQGYDCLLQYVQKDDGMFSWTDTGLRLNGTNDALLPKNRVSWTGYVLNVTSQAWLTPQDFNFTSFGNVPRGHVWWHILVVVVPSNRRPAATTDQSFLYLTGGNNNPGVAGGVPKAGDEDMLVVSGCSLL